jgi:HEAT repeat protein
LAAVYLGELKDPNTVDPLIKALDDKNSVFVRYSAAWALGELKDPKAVGPLIKLLEDDDSLIRTGSAEALGKIKDPKAIGPLIKLVESDFAAGDSAAKALVEIGAQSIGPLIQVLNSTDDTLVRRSVARALEELEYEDLR